MVGLRNAGACLLALALSATAARGAEPGKVATKYDQVYAKAGDDVLRLDVAYPAEGDGPFPAVLVIHGGGWRGGNKKDMRPLLNDLAARGYVAVSPQYRFCPRAIFPAQVHDVKGAVRWVRANAKDYKVDPAHVGAMGFSAGGHLALMLGVTQPADGLEGTAESDAGDSSVQAVVNYFGPTDLAASDIPTVSKPLLKDFLGGTPQDKPELAAQASPITFVSKGDAPILTFQGTRDPLVPRTQAIKLADRLTAAGVAGRVELMIGAGHGWGGDDLKHTQEETYQFLDAHLKPAKR